MDLSKRDLIFEVLYRQRLVVSCQSRFHPSDDEWSAWLNAVGSLEQRMGRVRLLVVTLGGHPTKAQSDRLRSKNQSNPQTSIVSPSVALRFFATGLSFINRNIGVFSPREYDKAFAHLALTASEEKSALEAVQRLEQSMLALSTAS